MAEIHVEADAVAATATALLALADDVNDVAFTHGPHGAMFVVPDALAEKLYVTSQRPTKATEAEAPKAPASDGAPPAPKQELRRPVSSRAKNAEQE